MIRIDQSLNIFQLVVVFGILFTFSNAQGSENTVSYTCQEKVCS